MTGFWQPSIKKATEIAQITAVMAETLIHRGPDDAGVWVDEPAGIALGFRRLAILDLSPLGHQPVVSANGRYVVVFNGEIYNFRDLRTELESRGHRFPGGSDTEVLLAASRVSCSLSSRALYVTAADSDAFIRLRLSYWRDTVSVVCGGSEAAYLLGRAVEWPHLSELEQRLMFVDTAMGLPDDMLTKVDRASSAVSLETRAPLLDQRVVEFASRLRSRMKVRSSGNGKWALRHLLRLYVPLHLFERQKQGFDVPIARWLLGPLRHWAEELLDERRLRREGFFDPALVRSRWYYLLGGTFEWEADLWIVLMFQVWKQRWLP